MGKGNPESFRSMATSTQEQWDVIGAEHYAFQKKLPERIITHLKMLDGDSGGFAVDRLTHSLQSATLAHRDGKDEEYVVCALLHDIGDILGTASHADVAAAIVKPFVSEENHWIVEQHGIFQGYYFFHYRGLDRNMREQFRGHPYFEACAQFCHKHDQNAFMPDYDTMPLDAFVPMIHRVFAKPKRTIYLRKDGKMATQPVSEVKAAE